MRPSIRASSFSDVRTPHPTLNARPETPGFVAATVNKYLGRPGAVVAVDAKKTEKTTK